MKIKISASQIQKQILAPSMQQSIEVLLLPITELNAAIGQELENNPLLEVNEENPKPEPNSLETELKERLERILQAADHPYYTHYADDEILEERPVRDPETLEETLLQQVRVEFCQPLDLKIAEQVIGNIDEDGYLSTTAEEIAAVLGIKDLERIEQVLRMIRNFEPIGIASRDLKECLLTQAEDRLNGHGQLVSRMIEECLKELGQKKFTEIARKLGVSIDLVKDAARFIATLDPKPARNYRPINAHIFVKPDIIVTENGNGYQVQLNEEGIPRLRINSIYKRMLEKNKLSDQEKEFINEKLKNALIFMKSIQQRGQTIKAITEYILKKQRAFFKDGHSALVPMTLKDVAKALDRNESTISRAINNKYIDSPEGLYPLKFFFSQGLNSADHENGMVSNRSIKEEIRELIEAEDKSSPLSDQELQKHFAEKGLTVARRTIGKYRQALKILPSHLRKE